MGRKRNEKGLAAPNTLVGGVPLKELQRQAALPCRPLMPADVPNEPWRDDYAKYQLRQDGTIMPATVSLTTIPLGVVRENGTVAWTRC